MLVEDFLLDMFESIDVALLLLIYVVFHLYCVLSCHFFGVIKYYHVAILVSRKRFKNVSVLVYIKYIGKSR